MTPLLHINLVALDVPLKLILSASSVISEPVVALAFATIDAQDSPSFAKRSISLTKVLSPLIASVIKPVATVFPALGVGTDPDGS
jgi:hypothetical protein